VYYCRGLGKGGEKGVKREGRGGDVRGMLRAKMDGVRRCEMAKRRENGGGAGKWKV